MCVLANNTDSYIVISKLNFALKITKLQHTTILSNIHTAVSRGQ